MQRIKLTILLPLGQLVLAAALLTVGQYLQVYDKAEPQPPPLATRVCLALNAPAHLTSLPISWVMVKLHFYKPPSAVLSPLTEIPFLAMVGILWYFVARWLVSLRIQDTEKDKERVVPVNLSQLIGSLFALAVGAILLYAVMGPLRWSWLYYQSISNLIDGICALLWSIAFFLFAGRSLLRNWRWKHVRSFGA